MKNLMYVLVLLLAFSTCKKKTTTTSDEQTGNITGKTTQYDQYGNQLSTGLNNIKVSLDNSPVTAMTDNLGNYTLSNVKPGIYTISFTKPGCDVYEVQQVNFPGNGTLYHDGYAIQRPTFTFLSATTSLDTTGTPYLEQGPKLKVDIKLNPLSQAVSVSLITGNTSNVDVNGSYIRMSSFTIPANTSDFTASLFYTPDMGNYVRVYPYAGTLTSYHDFASSNNFFQGFGTPLPALKFK